MTAEPIFVVDADHPGTSEESWMSGDRLACLDRLTLPSMPRVLVVAPHPDDEVLGAGGLIRRLSEAGSSVSVLAVTDGEASHSASPSVLPADLRRWRAAEAQLASSRLTGAELPRSRLSFPDGEVRDHEEALGRIIAGSLDASTLCLAPWSGDGHPDHDAAGRAAAWGCRRAGARLLSYLVWTWHWASPDDSRVPWSRALRWDLTEEDRAAKRWSIDAFATQIRPLEGDPRQDPPLPARVLGRWCRAFEVYLH